MGETTNMVIWQFIRAAGLLSYAMLSLSVFMGVAVKTRFLDGLMKRPWVYEAHQSITIAALGLIVLHLFLVMIDGFIGIGVAGVLVPFASPYRPLASALGTLAFYLVAALVLSTYLQRHIGYKAWRMFHYAGFAAWWMGLIHGLTAGSDVGLSSVQLLYWITAGAVIFITVYRILLPTPIKEPSTTPRRRVEGVTR